MPLEENIEHSTCFNMLISVSSRSTAPHPKQNNSIEMKLENHDYKIIHIKTLK